MNELKSAALVVMAMFSTLAGFVVLGIILNIAKPVVANPRAHSAQQASFALDSRNDRLADPPLVQRP
jgi:hypothetical protein